MAMFDFIKKTVDAVKKLDDALLLDVIENIDKDLLEDILVESDVNYELVEEILAELPSEVSREMLEPHLLKCFPDVKIDLDPNHNPFVQLIIGVNGAGKTTTIAKLAQRYKKKGKNVVLGASDTFRAAAIEQLTRWAKKIDVNIVASQQGHDPSAVAYDAIESAKAKNAQNVIIDTAGRLHTQVNLANELKKIVRVCEKAMNGAPHQKLLILDGTQGTSAINQASAFNEMIGIDAIIITKLDGTAKGGALFSISNELQLPIAYIGVGEKAEDLIEFDSKEFVSSLLDKLYTGHTKI